MHTCRVLIAHLLGSCLAIEMDQQTANWDHCLQHAALSDVGLCRANNQDALAVAIADGQQTWQKRGHLFIVADGMGAHAAGELASKLATDTVALTYSKLLNLAPPEALRSAIDDANAKIHARGQADEEFRGMGTTSTALLLLPEGALVAHVGDSRAYRLRGNRYEQLTFDHSLVWEMRAAGHLREDETLEHIPKNIITRSLGPNPTVQVDLEGPFPLAVGDTFLLCSDGLSGQVDDEEMGAILACMPPDRAVRALVDLANLRGGPDNITVIAVRVTGPQAIRSGAARPESSPSPATAVPLDPLILTLLGIFTLAGVGLFVTEHWMPAFISLLAAVATGMVALVRRYGSGNAGRRFDRRPLGKGPYRKSTCTADSEFVERLNQIIQELRAAAADENWSVDWSRFNAFVDRATTSKQARKYTEAIGEYFHAIGFMMDQLKHQRASSGDSVLDP